MNSLIVRNLEHIGELCRRYSVHRLAVFGSVVRDDFHPGSDVDFLVEFEPMAAAPHADSYFGLLADLEILLERRVDLLEPAALRNPYRRREIEATRTDVYRVNAADEAALASHRGAGPSMTSA